jgi:hypothetical protein
MTRGKWRSLFFAPDGALRFGETYDVVPLRQRLAAVLPASEAAEAAEFLEPMLNFDPLLRPSASQALASRWLSIG